MLASRSPQRRAILANLGLAFEVVESSFDEVEVGGDPEALALANARGKSRSVAAQGHLLVLGADTVVAVDGVSVGSPADGDGAAAMLAQLSGRTHEVMTALLILADGEESSALVRSEVTFRTLSAEIVGWYVATGEWRGRAGGYAIQGAGAALATHIHGDLSNIIGLPVGALLDLLAPIGIAPWRNLTVQG